MKKKTNKTSKQTSNNSSKQTKVEGSFGIRHCLSACSSRNYQRSIGNRNYPINLQDFVQIIQEFPLSML